MSEPRRAELDELWTALEPHVEWPAGLSLILLFAEHPEPVEELRERVEALLQDGSRTLRTLVPRSVEELSDVLVDLLTPVSEEVRAVWVELWRGSGGPGWDAGVGTILARLNERRTVLERVVRRPTVLVLPSSLRSKIYVVAPDLWTIRSFTADLPGPRAVTRGRSIPEPSVRPTFALSPPSAEEKEWARLLATGEFSRIDAWDGLRASEAALARGRLSSARNIAQQVITLVLFGNPSLGFGYEDLFRFLHDTKVAPTTGLLAAVQMLGKIEAETGNLASARLFLEYALAMSEQLEAAAPHEPQTQRNLAASLNNLGEVVFQMGDLTTARVLVQRALDVRENLATVEPLDVKTGRGMIIALNKLGSIEAALGSFTAARTLFQRSLDLSESIASANRHDAEAQRDLSVALERLGDVELRTGNLPAARSLFERMLDVRTKLAYELPDNAQAQLDLAQAHLSLAELGGQLDDVALEREHLHAACAMVDSWSSDLFESYAMARDLRQWVRDRIAVS